MTTDPQPPIPPMPSPPPAPPKRRGCFFYGCIISLSIVGLFMIMALFTVWYMVHTLNAMVAQYCDTQPMTMPVDTLSAAQWASVSNRFASFKSALDAHSNAPPLVLTGPELNALLSSSKDMGDLSNHFHLSIEGNDVKGMVSLPLGKFHIPFVNLNGRYLNGAGVFRTTLRDNNLSVRVVSLEVKGNPVPDRFMGPLQAQNFAEQAQQNPKNAEFISKFDSIEIKDGKVIIKPRGNP